MSVLKQPVVCQLLSEDENQRLLASLGAKCMATCAAVVCVYVPDGSVSWRQIHCGVATIEKDSFRKSYFVRVYDIVKFSQLHEEAMFLEMGYTVLTPNFHTFQGERSPMGLAFADVKEAKNFQTCFGSLVNRWTRKMNTGTQKPNITDSNPLQPPKPATERPIVCRLLSKEDRQRLRACLDGKSVVDCAAVVCVHVPAGTDSWRQLHSGVATIEEDSSQKACFIRVYDLKKSSKLHEEAIFLEMQYTAVRPNFHTLQGDRSPLGLAFADVEEASTFQQKFSDLLAKFSRKPATLTNSSGMVKSDSQPEINPMHVLELPVPEPAKSGFNLPGFRKKQKKAIIISAPTNFRHVQHMGFNKDSQQFDMSVLDEKMLQEFLKDNNLHCLFNTAEDTEFAAQFIAKNIGIKKFNHAMKSRAPPPPVVAPTSRTASPARSTTPPVPSFPNRPTMPPPPVPTNFSRPHAPPPPPPVQPRAPPARPTAPPARVGPPPPRGPASTGGAAPPPPPPAPAPAPSDRTDGGSQPPSIPMDLQSQIQSFNKSTLKRVTDHSEPAVTQIVTGDDHKDMLAATLSQALNHLMTSRRAYLSDDESSEDSDF